MLLSILIPAYDERYLVRECLRRVLEAPLPAGLLREVVVVDDGSRDGTGEVLAEIAAAHPGVVRLLRHDRNQGKGAAVRTAVRAASGDILLIQDADLEYDPADYGVLLQPLLDGEADVVYGSRFQGGGKRRVLLFWHSVANKALTSFSNMFTDLNLTDLWTGYKAMRAPFIKDLPLRCDGFGIEAELTAKLARQRCRIFEVPITYSGRTYEEGKKVGFWDAVRALGVIVFFGVVGDLYGEDQTGLKVLDQMGRATRFNDWMADALRPYLGTRILEVGAGTGNLTEHLWRRDAYIASDSDDYHHLCLTRRFANRPTVSVAKIDVTRGEDFAALKEAVDTVVCVNVLEHVEDEAAALRNLRSALVPGGRLVLLVPHLTRAFGTVDRAVGHLRRYEKADLSSALERAGFALEETVEFNRAALPGWLWNGKVLRRQSLGRVQLRLFDSLIWLLRRVDRRLPWPAQSLIAVARRT